MPATIVPLPVEKTDNFDQWRQKCNEAIQAIFDIVNANSIQTWIELNPPINNRDMLLYNSSTQTFQNTLVDIVMQDYLNDNGYEPASKVKRDYFAKINNLF